MNICMCVFDEGLKTHVSNPTLLVYNLMMMMTKTNLVGGKKAKSCYKIIHLIYYSYERRERSYKQGNITFSPTDMITQTRIKICSRLSCFQTVFQELS